MIKNPRMALAFIWIASFFLFLPSLNYYFFQDDWFVLNWANGSNLRDLLTFRSDIIYWRPLSMPIFFKLSNLIFGLNPFGFHMFSIIFHFINSALVYLLFRELKFKNIIAISMAFFYATASFHFIPLSWLSTASYVFGPTFVFSSLIYFLRDKILISFALFLLGLACSELTLTMIPIALLLKGIAKSSLLKITIFVLAATAYLAIRFILVPLPQEGQYNLAFAPKIFTNIFWYFMWVFNIPEAMSTVFYFSKFKQTLSSVLSFWEYIVIPVLMLIYFVVITFTAKINFKRVIVGSCIFLSGISPILFLPFHIYPMYLVIASVGIFYILASSLSGLKSRLNLTIYVLCILWLISTFLTLKFTRTNHWLVNLQSISKAYLQEAKSLETIPPNNSLFIFKFAHAQYANKHNFVLVRNEQNIKQALNDQDAIQVIYDNKSLRSFYETERDVVDDRQFPSHFVVEPR